MTKQLQNKLKSYSALTAVVTLIGSHSEAAVIHTNVNMSFGPGDTYDVDLDNNSSIDFSFRNNGTYYSSYGIAALYLDNFNSNRVAGTYGGYGYFYPTNFPSNSYIGSAYNTFYGPSYGSLNWFGYDGNFIGVSGAFIGVQFDISGSTHYGWIRIDVDASGAIWSVIDFAYESTPDTPIATGDTGSSVGVNELTNSQFNAVADQESLIVTAEATMLNNKLEVLNTQGQVVYSGIVTSTTNHISNSFPGGMYIVRVVDSKGKAVIRKVIL